eukprot:3520122-Rhodomonas_salina.3
MRRRSARTHRDCVASHTPPGSMIRHVSTGYCNADTRRCIGHRAWDRDLYQQSVLLVHHVV